MSIHHNIPLKGAEDRTFLLDLFINEQAHDLVIFCHGFKGFKDWGAWDAVGKYFADHDCHFVKFNFSHNGTTTKAPLDFDDLQAFGQNNYSKELNDFQIVIQWIKAQKKKGHISFDRLHLIGHSRGGPIALITGFERDDIYSVTTWAGVSDLSYILQPTIIDAWKTQGVHYIYNGRTQQQMPIFPQFGEDLSNYKNRFDLSQYQQQSSEYPKLHFIHGSNDKAVPIQAMHKLKNLFPYANTTIINDAGHTFGSVHPMPKANLPEALDEVCQASLSQIMQKHKHF